MKLAYFTHNRTLQDYKTATSPLEKRAIAVTYFESEAEHVNAEMKKKLEEEEKNNGTSRHNPR